MEHMQIAAYFDILNQAQKVYSRQLEPVCRKWDLTHSEVDVLLFLYNNPGFDRAADIVTRRGMTKSHVSMSVASLADRKLLDRHCSPVDRRTSHLRLLEEGIQIAREAREAQQNFFHLLYEGIPPEDLAHMERLTRRVFANIEKVNQTL